MTLDIKSFNHIDINQKNLLLIDCQISIILNYFLLITSLVFSFKSTFYTNEDTDTQRSQEIYPGYTARGDGVVI